MGYRDLAEAAAAGVVGTPVWNARQDRFMATSKNITMNLDANEYTIKLEGLDADVARILATAAPAVLDRTGMTRGPVSTSSSTSSAAPSSSGVPSTPPVTPTGPSSGAGTAYEDSIC